MADSDKDILITPNTGASAEPTIEFTGKDNTPITLRVLDDGTVSFEGTAGQLFSVSDGLSGTIFSVNDISGIPSIEVLDNGTVRLAEYNGGVAIGKASASTTLDVDGTVTATLFAGSGSALTGIVLDDSGVSASTYGSDSQVPVLTINSKGIITSASVANVSGGGTSLPDQTGNSGKYLTTNGTAASWDTIDLGTDTSGNYVATIIGTANEVEVTGSGSEGASVTIGLPTTISSNTTGSAATLTTARSIGLSGDVSGSASFNGSADIAITAVVADDSHNHIISNVDGLQSALDGKQALDADLTAIAALAGTSGFLKKTAANTWSLDTNTYLTGNQSISITGDASGSGTTSISLTLANSGVSASSYGSASSVPTFTVDAKGRLTAASNTSIAIAQSAVTNLTTDLSAKAPLASPALTGTPTAPTATVDTNTTQIATTAYVIGQAGSSTPIVNGTAAVGTSLRYARQDHVHGTDTTRAPLASPTFTGTVILPTSATGGASVRIPHGTAPTAPTNGDIWTTTAGLYARINGSTIGPYGIGTARTFYQTSAPSSPATGDIWVDSDEVYTTINPNDYALKSEVSEGGVNPFFLSGL